MTPHGLLLAASLALAGCGASGWAPDPASSLSLDAVGEHVHGRQQDAVAVAAQAALDLPCAAGVVARSTTSDDRVFRAEGCGHAITYVGAIAWGESSRVPFAPGRRVTVSLRRFIPVSREGSEAALSALERAAASIGVPRSVVNRDAVRDWADLYGAAARDLACPSDSLLVEIVKQSRAPSTYLAEGCGSRGLFVRNGAGALVITSRVALTPGK